MYRSPTESGTPFQAQVNPTIYQFMPAPAIALI